MDEPAWERARGWQVARRFVYYLIEDFIPPEWVPGRRTVDFSGGLGDLAAYLVDAGAAAVTLTVPERGANRPEGLDPGVEWHAGIRAADISSAFSPGSVDLFAARMVFQFPTWEGDRADPDSMLAAMEAALAPGGRVVLAVHEFFPMHPPGYTHVHEAEELLDTVTGEAADWAGGEGILAAEAARMAGLAEMVRFLGLPPREGPNGETGFGLKVPMLVESAVRAGLRIERVEHVEPFTFPLGLRKMLEEGPAATATLADRFFDEKREVFADPHLDPYLRPELIRRLLERLSRLTPLVVVPIVRLSAVKA